MTSEGIERFLGYLRDTEQAYRLAQAEEGAANDATQDILHAIELEESGCRRPARLLKKLKQVREKRRAAKDTPEIKGLERLLGEVRKAERRTENRSYTPRTNILEDKEEE